MARYWQSFAEHTREFQRLGISTDNVGFYDDPAFQRAERADPELLNSYAGFVLKRDFSDAYLSKARREIPFIAEYYRAAVAASGTTGACVDASMALSRILDREGFWNFCVKGSVRTEFAPAHNLPPSTFYQVDFGEHAAGHAWIVAPPFKVLDITIQLQEYDGNEREFLPQIIAVELVDVILAEPDVVISPEYRNYLLSRGVQPRNALERCHPNWREFTRCFKPSLVRHGETTLKYVPSGIGATNGPLEEITNRSYNGMSALQLYQAMQPALSGFRAAPPD